MLLFKSGSPSFLSRGCPPPHQPSRKNRSASATFPPLSVGNDPQGGSEVSSLLGRQYCPRGERLKTRGRLSILEGREMIPESRASRNKGLTRKENLPHYPKCRVITREQPPKGRSLNAGRASFQRAGTGGNHLAKCTLAYGLAKPGRRRPGRFRTSAARNHEARGLDSS